MAIKAVQVNVPANGSEVAVVYEDDDPISGDELSFRNTGIVDILVGGPGSCFYPLGHDPDGEGLGEALGVGISPGDVLHVKVAVPNVPGSPGGRITAIKAR